MGFFTPAELHHPAALFAGPPHLPPRPSNAVGQASSDLNREAWGCPPNLRNRTHPRAAVATGQTTGGPSFASKSVSISPVTSIAKPIMGASRIRAAVANADAQFRISLIAPSRVPKPLH